MTDRLGLAYGVMGLPLAFAALPLYVHVPHLYATVTSLSLEALGLILLVSRLFDALIDPWLGRVSDRCSHRPLLMGALILFGLGFTALLSPSPKFAALWLFLSLSLTFVGYSAATVVYQAWGAHLGENSQGRTRLVASREGFALLGVVLAAGLPNVLASESSEGVQDLRGVFLALLLISTFIFLAGVSGRSLFAERLENVLPRDPPLREVLQDASCVRLLIVFAANGLAAAIPATLFLFFVADVLHDEASSGPLLALYFLAGALSLPLWLRLAHRFGRVKAWLASMGLSILSFGTAGGLGSGDVALFALACFASGLALGADLAFPSSILADLGARAKRPGAYFGVWNFVAKLNLALAAGATLPFLSAWGYSPGKSEGVDALVFAYAIFPLILKFLAGLLIWRWRFVLEFKS